MLTIDAPAKLNLYLKILSKREDGYHEIKTLFEKIDLCDTVTVDIGLENSIRCDLPKVPTGKESLIGKCVRRFSETAKIKERFNIGINKKIPIAAGLGGGSSDAAAVLKGLNEITQEPLTIEQLIEIGKELGADIPFFLTEYSFGFGKGKGERIEKGETEVEMAHILLNPPYEVCTADIYSKVSAFNLTNTEGIDRMFNTFLKENDITSIAENICNDLQTIVLQEIPPLEKAFKELIRAGAKGVLLSGSGPTVFGIFEKSGVKRAKEQLEKIFTPKDKWRIFEAHTY
ncbi:MAG: 4-(cytidine 5'-diphospho)-2-C-methyl-D-erythritol kinase [Candidatus Omnitrophota bacterium]